MNNILKNTLFTIVSFIFCSAVQAKQSPEKKEICNFDVGTESFKPNQKNDAYSKVFKTLFNDAPRIEKKETDTDQEVLDKINKYMPSMTCIDTIDDPKEYLSYDSSSQKYTYKIKDYLDYTFNGARTNYLIASYTKKIGVGKGYNILHGWVKYNKYSVDNFYISVLNASKQLESVVFEVSLEKAKKINDNILPIYIYGPLYAKTGKADSYEVTHSLHSVKDATISSQTYKETNDYYINVEIIGIWFYDPLSNEIIYKSSPFNYRNKGGI